MELWGGGTSGKTLGTGVDGLVTELLPVDQYCLGFVHQLTQFGEAGCTLQMSVALSLKSFYSLATRSDRHGAPVLISLLSEGNRGRQESLQHTQS